MTSSRRLRLFALSFLAMLVAGVLWGTGQLTGAWGPLPDRTVFELISQPPAFADRLVSASAERFEAQGDADLAGFMRTHPPEEMGGEMMVAERAIRMIDGPGVERAAYPYASHFGLQYVMLREAVRLGIPATVATAGFSVLCVALSAAMIGVIALWSARQGGEGGGETGGWCALALCALSPMFLERTASIYWVNWAAFAPLCAGILFAPHLNSRRTWAWFLATIFLLLFIKSLMGYEFLTNIVLASATPVVFRVLLEADRWSRAALLGILWRGAAIVTAGVAGFLLAVLLHALKAAEIFGGDLSKGFETVLIPFSYSVAGGEGAMRNIRIDTPAAVVLSLAKAFALRGLATNLLLWGGLIWFSAAAIRAGIRTAGQTAGRADGGRGLGAVWAGWSPRTRALWRILPLALVAMLSWHGFATVHALVHSHVVWFTVQLNLVPVAAALIGAMRAEARAAARSRVQGG